MMSLNKRKIILSDESEEDDSFKYRRSSLQVNLSYSTDLTDSGNVSVRKTENADDERKTNRSQANRRLSRSGNIHEKKNHQTDSEDNGSQAANDTNKLVINDSGKPFHIKEGIQLKCLTIDLEDIYAKQKTLERNCKHLKCAILSKTKEMFDKQNELSIKTAMVFGSEEDHCTSSMHELKNDIENKPLTMLDTINLENKVTMVKHKKHIVDSQQREDECPGIIATPISSDRQGSKRTMNKSRLSQKRLFIEPTKEKCKIIEDIVLEKRFPLLSLRQADPGNSPILSSNNQRLRLLKSKLHSQNQFENHNNSTIQCDQSIDISTPIVCSTFIEDNGTDGKRGKTICNANSDRNTSCTTNKTVSMELTGIIGGIQKRQNTLLQNKNPNTNDYIKNSIEKNSERAESKESKNATVEKLEDDTLVVNKLVPQNNIVQFYSSHMSIVNDQDVENTCIDSIRLSMQPSTKEIEVIRNSRDNSQVHECDSDIKNQNERQCLPSPSDNDDTIRSSLSVNTSLDVVTTASKARNVEKSNGHEIIDINQDFAISANNEKPVTVENQRTTIDFVHTSLQMNTSVDSRCRTWSRKSNCPSKSSMQDDNIDDLVRNHSNVDSRCSSVSENKEENIDSLENISLIERLRNISTRNQISETNNKNKVTDTGFNNNVINVKHQNSMRVSEDSYVEATPYPISRSVLFKSQLRHKTQNLGNGTASSSNNINPVITKENSDKTKADALYSKAVLDEVPVSSETLNTNEADTIILGDTFSGNPFVTQNTLTVITDTPGETMSKAKEKIITSQNTECIPSKKSRRKLLPLHESSQLCSLTPVEENKRTSESSTSVKKHKVLKKKRPGRKLVDFKNKTSLKSNVAYEETSSDSDYDTFKNKNIEKRKIPRKPRKVISKKIVIKKFVEENVLNILKENERNKGDVRTAERDSLNDFAKCRTISTHWNRYKSHKIIIVTTGLSKGDKNLVKSIIKSLGAAEMELNVSRRTTHVISSGVRTVNLLRGIIRGCWLITLEWVFKSLESNAWLNPEQFEMKHFSKAVQENRKDRQLFGPSYIPELFTTCGFIHVEHKTVMPYDTLKELIKTAGGHITENVKFAKIIIGENGLRETWIIDSITTGELQSTKLYERK